MSSLDNNMPTAMESPAKKRSKLKLILVLSGIVAVLAVIVVVLFNVLIPKNIKINEDELDFNLGETINIEHVIFPKNAIDKVTYTISDENIVRLDENGNLIANGLGDCTITVKTINGLKRDCQISVHYGSDAFKRQFLISLLNNDEYEKYDSDDAAISSLYESDKDVWKWYTTSKHSNGEAVNFYTFFPKSSSINAKEQYFLSGKMLLFNDESEAQSNFDDSLTDSHKDFRDDEIIEMKFGDGSIRCYFIVSDGCYSGFYQYHDAMIQIGVIPSDGESKVPNSGIKMANDILTKLGLPLPSDYI